MDSMRTIFMGSPEFAVPTLSALAGMHQIVGVVTQPDRPSGRGRKLTPPPVKEFASSQGMPILQPEKLKAPEAFAWLQERRPELVVVVAYGQILRREVLELPGYGCINLHASLLPRHRGAAPIPAAILAGDGQTGITMMKMDPGMDTGPILAQMRIPIMPGDTTLLLGQKLSELAAETLNRYLPVYLEGSLAAEPQDDRLATYAPQLKKEDGFLNMRQPAAQLVRRVCAFTPWPGAFFHWKGLSIKVLEADFEPGIMNPHPGKVILHGIFPAIETTDGLLILRKLQLPGKLPLNGDTFLHGTREFVGSLVDPGTE